MSQNNSNEKAASSPKSKLFIRWMDLILRRLLWIIQIWEPERCASASRHDSDGVVPSEISGRTHCGTGEFCKGLLCGNCPRVSKL